MKSGKKIKTYYLAVLGCQMNMADAERLRGVLEQAGLKPDREQTADLIAVVACSVRQAAVDRVFGWARNWQARRGRGRLRTVLTGCVLAGDSKKLAKFFDFILPITDIGRLPKLLKLGRGQIKNDYLCLPPASDSSFQALVPIMTGCNNFCAYCVVPYVRGREMSRPAADIISECQKLIKRGYKEITLLGQNVNSYKSYKSQVHKVIKSIKSEQKEETNFPKLLKKIDRIKGNYWLKFVTSHPKDFSNELIEVMASGRHLAPYLHLPLQAGDDRVLKNMNRGYTVAHYLALIKKARRALPYVVISTDVIVGFPGETREQFSRTLKVFKQVRFNLAFIARYSPRLGTAAFRLKDDVSPAEKKRRFERLNTVLADGALKENKKLVGQTSQVLVDGYKNGRCLGRTAGGQAVAFAGAPDLVGHFVAVKITSASAWSLAGEMV